jgi:hypothetical protein
MRLSLDRPWIARTSLSLPSMRPGAADVWAYTSAAAGTHAPEPASPPGLPIAAAGPVPASRQHHRWINTHVYMLSAPCQLVQLSRVRVPLCPGQKQKQPSSMFE